MLASKMFLPTMKEAPTEATVTNHRLLLRAGMIRKVSSGIYNYMPLGLKVIQTIERVVREEMNSSGAIEFSATALQPKELWDEASRWDKYGPELMRLKDRGDREYCLGPTAEEIFTDIARNDIKSVKNLPLNLYQIQTKYRDEMRPRFGLMRGREFIMKDAYSFDKDTEGLNASYDEMYKAYERIFNRLKIRYRVVLADTGNIGGSESHQFMALCECGESTIAYCLDDCYAADIEKAIAIPQSYYAIESSLELKLVHTPKARTVTEVSDFLNVDLMRVCKTIVYKNTQSNTFFAVCVLGHREVNIVKVVNHYGITENDIVLATTDDIVKLGSVLGFVGPQSIKEVLIDNEVSIAKNLIIGANKVDYHLINANYNRDFAGIVGDFRDAVNGDRCPACQKPLATERGIEIGQLFKLGTKYSSPMKACYQSDKGMVPFEMGCYGIGITRTLASIIEQNNDEKGIIWPVGIAPYDFAIVPINFDDASMRELSTEIYSSLKSFNGILDDRKAQLGFKLGDWELIGIPYVIICGRDSANGIVELRIRAANQKLIMNKEDAITYLGEALE